MRISNKRIIAVTTVLVLVLIGCAFYGYKTYGKLAGSSQTTLDVTGYSGPTVGLSTKTVPATNLQARKILYQLEHAKPANDLASGMCPAVIGDRFQLAFLSPEHSASIDTGGCGSLTFDGANYDLPVGLTDQLQQLFKATTNIYP
jgi:ABC-type amino acid transport substrate-binding protein